MTTPELKYTTDNVVVLAANDDDCQPYTGGFRSSSVYIVGYGTKHEKVFHRGQKPAMAAYAQEHSLDIVQASAGQICDSVMREALGVTTSTRKPKATAEAKPKEAAAKDETYDPGDHNVDDVLEHVEKHPDERKAVLKAEKAGQARKTLIEGLEAES